MLCPARRPSTLGFAGRPSFLGLVGAVSAVALFEQTQQTRLRERVRIDHAISGNVNFEDISFSVSMWGLLFRELDNRNMASVVPSSPVGSAAFLVVGHAWPQL